MALVQGKGSKVEALVAKLVAEAMAELGGAETPEPKTTKAMGKVVGRTRGTGPSTRGS